MTGCAGLVSACCMAMGGKSTVVPHRRPGNNVEHVVEVTAERRAF